MGSSFNPQPNEDDISNGPDLVDLAVLAAIVALLAAFGAAIVWGVFHIVGIMLA